MKRFLSLALTCIVALSAHALTVKPNVGPVIKAAIPDQTLYNGSTAIVDMSPYFRDPDSSAAAKVVTPLGPMNFTLEGETTPATVANFLNYITSGRWAMTTAGVAVPTFVHRSAFNGATPFVLQAGGFLNTADPNGDANPTQVATFPPVVNEPFISNTRGTIAMAKLGGDPNSATSQWFINMGDNSANLDSQNSGFTVFGHVAGSGMTVADAIAAQTRLHFNSPFEDLPVRNYTSGNVKQSNIVTTDITQISPLVYSATSSNDGVATATGGGAYLLVKGNGIGTATINVTATDLDGSSISQTLNVTVNAAPARLTNISSRALCATGDNVLIGGFIVAGGSAKNVVMRALGPSLAQFGVQNTIADPGASLHDTQSILSSNDNWASGPHAELITGLARNPEVASE